MLGLLLEKNEVHRLAYLLPKLFSLLSGEWRVTIKSCWTGFIDFFKEL